MQTFGLGVIKLAAGSSVRIQKVSVRALWRRMEEASTNGLRARYVGAPASLYKVFHMLTGRRKWQYACRLLWTSSPKEGAV
jgi:hypothetical protein